MSSTVPHLAGNFAPVDAELTVAELPVAGRVPPELTGWYLRNGPNPHSAASAHWFFGDGMVHAVRLEGGRATAYRNRWVRTRRFVGDGARERPDGSPDFTAGPANTHVIRHAGHILALVESSLPYELTAELDTVGPFDFGGGLRSNMTAHPKTCPDTGELHFFGYRAVEPYLTYHRADAAGNLLLSRPVAVTGPTMLHDFALTAEHVVFMDLPVVFDRQRLAAGSMPFGWSDDYPARLGVLRRDDPFGAVRWFDIDPCYVFHALNAHDEPGRIVLHVMRYPELWREHSHGFDRATLWRWTIDLAAGAVAEQQLDDRAAEFPRIDDRLTGLDARYGHATVAGPDGGAVVRYDLRTGAAVAHEFGAGRVPAEAAFAPTDDRPGGPGYLMTYVYDAATDRSDLVILDASDPAAPPQATICLPARVPFGFHGSWLPDLPPGRP